MVQHPIRNALTRFGVFTAHPAAFMIVAIFVAVWAVVEPETLDWHGAATIATWLMTLFIQRAAHRDTQALQGKLDELLRAHGDARTELAGLDQQEPEEIEAHRAQAQRDRL